MPLITRTEVDGYITCGRDRVAAATAGKGECPGYQSEPTRLVVEEIARTFADEHGDESDPYARLTSSSRSYLHTVDGEPATCRHCGSPANLSLEPRPQYARLSDSGPDALVERANRDERERAALSVDERQAAALEKLAAGAAASAELEQMRALTERQGEQIERLLAQLESNGGTAPRARAKPKPAEEPAP